MCEAKTLASKNHLIFNELQKFRDVELYNRFAILYKYQDIKNHVYPVILSKSF